MSFLNLGLKKRKIEKYKGIKEKLQTISLGIVGAIIVWAWLIIMFSFFK